ncbi:hypothetical protein [Pararhizobium sp. DWP1-1-3]|uniref:hypothetical protein n=1 Tax=Pararhizobium sp. DWP1-1-3 TaxID=2804652 RepID=UPI003CEF531E
MVLNDMVLQASKSSAELIEDLCKHANASKRALQQVRREKAELETKLSSRQSLVNCTTPLDEPGVNELVDIAARKSRISAALSGKRRENGLVGSLRGFFHGRARVFWSDETSENILRGSNLFDAAWYNANYRDVAGNGIDPVSHYVRYGFGEGRWPNALFDTRYYLKNNRDVLESGHNPLAHYIQNGWREARNPNPFFDVNFYVSANADVALAGVEPLSHYLSFGFRELRETTTLFSIKDFIAANKHLDFTDTNVLAHFLHT